MRTSLVTDNPEREGEETVNQSALAEGAVASTPGWQFGRVFTRRKPAVRFQGCY